jgi:hypothetical protein
MARAAWQGRAMARTASDGSLDVLVEQGGKRAFATAVDWPGWCRSGRTEQDALSTLAAYAGRYGRVATEAGLRLPDRADDPAAFTVVERVPGNATTDFGAPAVAGEVGGRPCSAQEAARAASLVAAAWAVLALVAAGAPEQLRKGPRGGGRDRDEVVQHVLNAEAAYARKLGVTVSAPDLTDRAAVEAMHADLLAVLSAPSDGVPAAGPRGGTGWAPRYAAHRIAWHVLDHAWEIEDKSD